MIKKFNSKFKKYVYRNSKSLFVILLILILSNAAASLPYIGIFLSLQNRMIGIWIITLILLRPQPYINFAAAFAFLILALVCLFLGMVSQAEELGVVVFVMFSLGIGFYINDFLKNGK